jgi:hypothetical protein
MDLGSLELEQLHSCNLKSLFHNNVQNPAQLGQCVWLDHETGARVKSGSGAAVFLEEDLQVFLNALRGGQVAIETHLLEVCFAHNFNADTIVQLERLIAKVKTAVLIQLLHQHVGYIKTRESELLNDPANSVYLLRLDDQEMFVKQHI